MQLIVHSSQREQFSNYQDYFSHLLSSITSLFTSGGWGFAIGTGRLLIGGGGGGNPNRVGAAALAADNAAEGEEMEEDMMKSVDAVTTIKVQSAEDRVLHEWSRTSNCGCAAGIFAGN